MNLDCFDVREPRKVRGKVKKSWEDYGFALMTKSEPDIQDKPGKVKAAIEAILKKENALPEELEVGFMMFLCPITADEIIAGTNKDYRQVTLREILNAAEQDSELNTQFVFVALGSVIEVGGMEFVPCVFRKRLFVAPRWGEWYTHSHIYAVVRK